MIGRHKITKVEVYVGFNTLRPAKNGCNFVDDIFKCIFFNEKMCNVIQISFKFNLPGPIHNKLGFIYVMGWHQTGNKLLTEPMLTKNAWMYGITRPQCVKAGNRDIKYASYQ